MYLSSQPCEAGTCDYPPFYRWRSQVRRLSDFPKVVHGISGRAENWTRSRKLLASAMITGQSFFSALSSNPFHTVAQAFSVLKLQFLMWVSSQFWSLTPYIYFLLRCQCNHNFTMTSLLSMLPFERLLLRSIRRRAVCLPYFIIGTTNCYSGPTSFYALCVVDRTPVWFLPAHSGGMSDVRLSFILRCFLNWIM